MIQFYNDAYRPSMGVSGKHPKALGQKGEECWPEIWPIIAPMIHQVRTKGIATWSEDQLIPIYRNGQLEDVYWTFSYSPILGESEEVEGVLVVCQETTEKVKTIKALERSEKALKVSEERIRNLIEAIPFPVGVYTGKEMKIEFANQSVLDTWGKGNDVVGKLYHEVLPELNPVIYEQLDKVYTTGIPFHAKNERIELMMHGRLEAFYFNYTFTPLHDSQGNVYGVLNTAANVTDLINALSKVEQSEMNLRNMIMQSPVAMCIMMGPEHVVTVANERIIHLWGKEVDEVMNRPIFVGLPDATGQGLEEILKKVYATGETFRADEHPVELIRNGNYELVYLNFVYVPHMGIDGSVEGILAVAVDVTPLVLARHKIEEIVAKRTSELAFANDSLQKSNAELAQFAYIASHDLQEPLRKISTFSKMLEEQIGKDIDEPSQKYLSKIHSSSLRLNLLIRDILSYSELDKGKEQFSKVDLNQILESIKTDYELLIDQRQASMVCDPLPVIEAIPLQMSQLFSNMISNALKFARKDIPPVITITAQLLTVKQKEECCLMTQPEYYKITFADNGIGFLPQYANQIFNIFQRLHRKSDYEGTGIGLALCKKIVMNHHGLIKADHSSDAGAVFDIILPAKQ